MSSSEEKYKDIIRMERPWDAVTLRKHPRMDLSARAKIFSPFAAVRGHSDRLREEDDSLARVERRYFSEEDTVRLSAVLSSLKKGMHVTVTYFLPCSDDPEMGDYMEISGRITAVDDVFRTLRLALEPTDSLAKERSVSIPFYDIASVDHTRRQ